MRIDMQRNVFVKAPPETEDTDFRAAIASTYPPDGSGDEGEITEKSEAMKRLPQGSMVYAASTRFKPQGQFKPTNGKPRMIRFLHRGEVTQPREEVSPGTLPVFKEERWQFNLPEGHDESDRRAVLAKWLVRKDHPLTWRVIANRVWQWHFSEGLVATPNDFGELGQLPSHPQLLDWLALYFRDRGGSFKKLHKLVKRYDIPHCFACRLWS